MLTKSLRQFVWKFRRVNWSKVNKTQTALNILQRAHLPYLGLAMAGVFGYCWVAGLQNKTEDKDYLESETGFMVNYFVNPEFYKVVSPQEINVGLNDIIVGL